MNTSMSLFYRAFGLTLLLLPVCGYAQVVDQYFPAMGTGAGELSEEPAQIRATQAYQPLGARWGPLSVHADGAEGIGYSSNVDLLPQTIHRSASIDTQGHVGVVAMFEHDNQAHADISVDDTRYPSRSLQNRTTWNASVGATHHFGRDELGVSFTHLSLVQMPTESGALILVGPVPYNLDDGRISYLIQTHGRISFIPEINVQHYYFGTPSIVNNPLTYVNQSYRDRVIVNEGFTARYEILKNSHLLFLARGTQISYGSAQISSSSSDQGFPTRNSNGFSVLGGYDSNEAGPIRFRAVVGYQLRAYSAALYERVTSPIAEASLRWEPTRLTSAVVSVTHGIEDSAFESVLGYTNTQAQLTVTHAFARNIVFGFHSEVRQASYPSTSSKLAGTPIYQQAHNQNMYGFGINGTFYLNRHISLSLSYDYSSQSAYLGPMFPVHVVQGVVHFAL
ncbi:outer membrane beta-barrel protein [Acetobacter fallax]|nr:outer membrane beta-barrel protein [Acetobacter fallax]